MNFDIDKAKGRTISAQLFQQIESKIILGEFKPGDKLPTMMEMERLTGTSIGTIKKVFKKLSDQGLINTIQGSGSYVLEQVNKNENIRNRIRFLIEYSNTLGIGAKELESLIIEELHNYYESKQKIIVALVDCCAEALNMVCKYMESNRYIKIIPILLSDLDNKKDFIINECDLVITTVLHFNKVEETIGKNTKLIIKIIFDLKMSSVISLAKISSQLKVAFWSASEEFNIVMKDYIDRFDNIHLPHSIIGENNLGEIKDILKFVDYLIIPSEYKELNMSNMKNVIHDYEMAGGRVVIFEYQLNEGSLINLEDMMLELYNEKNKF